MDKEILNEFKSECKKYLTKMNMTTLCSYGRYLRLTPSLMNKSQLIEMIVGVLSGEIEPSRKRNGLPKKYNRIPTELIESLERLRQEYLFVEDKVQFKKLFDVERIQVSKFKTIGVLRPIDRVGRLSLSREIRARMDLTEDSLVEEMLYQDENGDIVLLIKKFSIE